MAVPHFLWLDLETTGLDPTRCQIVEVAASLNALPVLDALLDGPAAIQVSTRFDPDGSARSAVDGMDMAPNGWDDAAWIMHWRSGLLRSLAASPKMSLEFAENVLLEAVQPFDQGAVVLAGNSPHFDRAFLRVHMPRLDARLSYRHMDVSCLTTFFEVATGMPRPRSAPAHRARADIEHSMAMFRQYVTLMRDDSRETGGSGAA